MQFFRRFLDSLTFSDFLFVGRKKSSLKKEECLCLVSVNLLFFFGLFGNSITKVSYIFRKD